MSDVEKRLISEAESGRETFPTIEGVIGFVRDRVGQETAASKKFSTFETGLRDAAARGFLGSNYIEFGEFGDLKRQGFRIIEEPDKKVTVEIIQKR